MLHRLLAALKSVPKELPQPSARCLYALATTAPAPNSTGLHKFIGFHTHIWANLQYLRYWWLQRELTLLFISAAIQLLLTSIVLARFELFSFVSTAAYPFTIFLLRFNLLSLCAMYSFLLLVLFVSLGRCRCVFTAMKRDLSSCICCILALAMPYSLFRYTIFSSTPVFAFMFECEKCIVNNRHLTFISSDGILRCNEIQ